MKSNQAASLKKRGRPRKMENDLCKIFEFYLKKTKSLELLTDFSKDRELDDEYLPRSFTNPMKKIKVDDSSSENTSEYHDTQSPATSNPLPISNTPTAATITQANTTPNNNNSTMNTNTNTNNNNNNTAAPGTSSLGTSTIATSGISTNTNTTVTTPANNNNNTQNTKGNDFKIKKKAKQVQESVDVHNESEQKKSKNSMNCVIKPTLDKLNINKTFQEIVDSAIKDQSLMMILRTILTEGKRALNEKNIQIKKRQLNLKNSNLSEQEYRRKHKEIIVHGENEIREIKDDIYNKLCASKIKGFETKETLLDNLKLSFSKKKEIQEQFPGGDFEIHIDENELKTYKCDLILLIEKLLDERQFIDTARLNEPSNLGSSGGSSGINKDTTGLRFGQSNKDKLGDNMNKDKYNVQDSLTPDDSTTKRKASIDQPQQAQSYAPRKKNICLLNESLLHQGKNDLSLDYYEKVEWDKFGEIKPNEKIFLKKAEIENLSETTFHRNKNDEKSQQEFYNIHTNNLRTIEKTCSFDIQNVDDSVIKTLINASNYVLYNVVTNKHTTSEGDMIHPNDILYLINKFE